jgi:hypothetical protein
MDQIVLEQCMRPPIRVTDIEAMERQGEWCLRQYRVRHLLSLLSADGERLICAFDAPDAESLRNVMRQLGRSYESLWAASVHGPPAVPVTARLPEGDTALVVVERSFNDPVRFEEIQAIEDRGAWCLEAHRVRFLRTYSSRDRRRMICVYSAPDAESVRLAQNEASMPLQTVWAAIAYQPAPA